MEVKNRCISNNSCLSIQLPTIFPLNQVYHDYAIERVMVNSWFGLGFVGGFESGYPREKTKQFLSQGDPQESNHRPRNHQPLADNDIHNVQDNNHSYY